MLRWFGDSAALLTWASAVLLATNLLWIVAVVLNVTGPLGPVSAGEIAWVVLVLDVPGVLLFAAAYAALTREQGRGWIRRRAAITAGFVAWAGLSVYWRFVLPLFVGTDLQDIFLGLLHVNPGSLQVARESWAIVDEILAVWIAAAAVLLGTHVAVAWDYRRTSDDEWPAGLPAYAWVLGTGLSLLSTILIVAALLPVLAGSPTVGSTYFAGAIGKLLVAPNLMLSGYTSSLQLGLATKAARRSSTAG